MRIQLEKRPLLIALSGLAVGLTAVHYPANLFVVAVLLGLCRSLRSWMVLAVAIGVGLVLSPTDRPILASPTFTTGPIKVLSVPTPTQQDVRFEGEVEGLRIRMSVPDDSDLHFGDLLQGGVLLSPVPEDREAAFRDSGWQGTARLSKAVPISPGPRIFSTADWFKDRFSKFVTAEIGEQDASWIEAFWFRSRRISPQEQTDLIASGSYTFIAASSLQVYLLFGASVWLLGAVLQLDRRLQIGAALAILVLYWLATGLHGNTLRASITCIALAGAYLVRREPDICSVTALAGLMFLIVFPRSVYSLGFQISMFVPIAIGMFFHSSRRPGIQGRLIDYLRGMAIVFLAGQPLIAAHTGHIGLGQLASTAFLSLLTPVILVGSLGAFASSFVFRALARGLLIGLVAPLTECVRASVEFFAKLPLQFELPGLPSYWICVYYGAWLFTWRGLPRKAD
jgi:predicted membrane metal-binding protein